MPETKDSSGKVPDSQKGWDYIPPPVPTFNKKTGRMETVPIETPIQNPRATNWETQPDIPNTSGAGRVPLPVSGVPQGALPSLKSLFGGKSPEVVGGGGVPSGVSISGGAAPQQAKIGMDPEELQTLMHRIVQPIDPNLIQAATTPMAGQHALTIPQGMQQPIAPFQQRPLNREPVVGAGNARARGIANAFTGVTNAIGSITHAKAQQLHDKIAVSTERLMQAQQQIDQAQMILKNDPNNAAAKQLLEQNQKVMNTILSDDKVRKGIEKGMNISFTDPSKNQEPEHKAVEAGRQSAIQNASQPSFQEQFSKQIPQQMGFDPIAQARLQSAMTQQKAQMETFKSISGYLQSIVRGQTGLTTAQIHDATRAALANQRWINTFQLQDRKYDQIRNVMGQKHANDIDLIRERSKDYTNSMEDIYKFKLENPSDLDKAFLKAIEKGDSLRIAASDEIRKVQNDMNVNHIQVVPVPAANAPQELKDAFNKLPAETKYYNILLNQVQTHLGQIQTSQDDLLKSRLASGLGGGEDAGQFADKLGDGDTGGTLDFNDINSYLTTPTDNAAPGSSTTTTENDEPVETHAWE